MIVEIDEGLRKVRIIQVVYLLNNGRDFDNPGTTIFSDCWKGYKHERLGSTTLYSQP